MRDPENEDAAGQLTQLLIDESKPDEAIALLQQFLQRAPSAGLYDQLGEAYGQMHDLSHAAEAYRQAVDPDPGRRPSAWPRAQCSSTSQSIKTPPASIKRLVDA